MGILGWEIAMERMVHRRVPLLSTLWILALVTTGYAADQYRRDISGVVFDTGSQEALPYAGVSIKGTRIGTMTNATGHFVLVGVPTAACTLKVSMIGYEPLEYEVDAGVNVADLTMEMVPVVIEQDAIFVYADHYSTWKQSEEVGQMSLSPRNLQDLPGFGEVDVFRSLQLLPGVSAIGDGSAGLYVRGGSPDQNLVLFDGMTIYHVDHFFGMFSAFNSEAVKDVQLFTGGYPARFGGRTSSVVEITGKTGDTRTARANIGANLLSANAVAEVPLFGNGSWLFSVRRSYTDVVQSGLYTSLFSLAEGGEDEAAAPGPGGGGRRFGGMGSVQQQTLPDFYFYDLNSKLTYCFTDADVVALSLYAGRDNLLENASMSGLQFSGETSATGTRVSNQHTNWGNLGASLSWTRQWSPRLSTKAQIAGSRYTSAYDNERSMEQDDDTSEEETNRFGSFMLDEDNSVRDITATFDGTWHATRNHTLGFGISDAELSTDFVSTFNDTITRVDRAGTSRLLSAYAEDRWQIFRPLEITGGMRVASYDQTSGVYVEPRAAAQLAVSDHISLSGAWGRYHQYVNRVTNEDILEGSRDFWIVADDTLMPGYSEHFVLGMSWENPSYIVKVEGYRKTFGNLLEYTRREPRPGQEVIQPFYLGTGTAHGLEFLAQKKEGMYSGWVSYTLGKVDHTFPDLNGGGSFPAAHDRRHEFKAVGIYKSYPWTLSSTLVFATGSPYTVPESQYFLTLLDGTSQSYIHVGDKNGNRLPNYGRLDVSASMDLNEFGLPGWQVGASVLNLFDHLNVRYRSYDLDVTPIVVSDVLDLGFSPTIFIKAAF